MNDWHKWSERKPTEADARRRFIECAWNSGWRAMEYWDASYGGSMPKPDYWRTPTPLPGEESPVNDDAPMLNALLRAGRYIDVLATWECNNGTMAAVMESETSELCADLGRVAVLDSPREVRSAIAGALNARSGSRESGPAVAGKQSAAPSKEGAAPAAAGSDAVRVLEALVESAKRTMIFNRDTVSVSAERYHCAMDTYQTFVAALAAVKAQEGKS